MKKLLCIVLVLVLTLCSCSFAFGEEETISIEFEPTLTNALDHTSSIWFQSSANRAFFSVVIASDLLLALDDDSNFDVFSGLAKTSYVGKDGSTLMLVYEADEKILVILYDSTEQAAAYGFVSGDFNETFVEIILSGMCSGGYYKNDLEELVDAANALKQILSA